MARRRFLPLIVALLAGTAVLIVRLAQVQIVEGATWSDEAANLVRTGTVRPYKRGAILDREGRVVAHDETTYRVEFRYREFRRTHPLGLVAHARSALLGEPVRLTDALENLPQWTDELIQLSAHDLDEFANGRPISLGRSIVAGTPTPDREQRRSRRGDVRFYVAQLFSLDRKEAQAFARATLEGGDESLLDLAVRARKTGDVETLRKRLHERLVECSEDLDVLARALDADHCRLAIARDADPRTLASARDADQRVSSSQAASAHPLEDLVARLEGWRDEVEDDAAGELFEEASGVPAGRVEAATIASSLDLEWLQRLLRWDDARTLEWLERARSRWRESLFAGQVERVVTEIELEVRDGELPERVLDRWSELFAAEPERVALEGWRAAHTLAVVDALGEIDSRAWRTREQRVLLPFQDADALGAAERGSATWTSVARAELGATASEAEIETLARAWGDALDERFDRAFLHEHTRAVLTLWEQELQRAVRDLFEERESADGSKLALDEGRLDRAIERAQYVLKDRGSRRQSVSRRPSYATVHLLARHADRFGGFEVEDANERVRLIDERGLPVLGALIGEVGDPTLRESLEWRSFRDEFDDLRRKGSRSGEEDERLRYMARRVVRPDEFRGRSGIEGYFDRELSGRNGYSEHVGLQDVIEDEQRFDLAPEDGSDLKLTLDLALQRAATETLAHPDGDPESASCDYAWLARPTGAIVLATVEGDVLAAASYPDFERGPGEMVEPADRELVPPADRPFERTLRKPTFQPPGSCFKPFVATWALDHVRFDPAQREICTMLPDGKGAGYLDVRCAKHEGHGPVDLHEAIKVSCNAYFARLGERFTQDDWVGMAAEFGFGRASGVRAFGSDGDRSGLLEDRVGSLFTKPITGRSTRLAGNGLAVVEATPMQLARATAGLATGVLPEMRMVDRIGALEAPRASRKLPFSSASLAFVRDAMASVANDPSGSGQRALNSHELSFRMAAKTGSGDIGVEKVETGDGAARVHKHTWVIGYFPLERPKYVLVVFCHDTLQTASHSAIWVARQFLKRQEVQALVRGEDETR